jgi:hypothetical protein
MFNIGWRRSKRAKCLIFFMESFGRPLHAAITAAAFTWFLKNFRHNPLPSKPSPRHDIFHLPAS